MAERAADRIFVIQQQPGHEWGGAVVGVTKSQVIASMATQAGWEVQTNLPMFETTQDFITWTETSGVDVGA